MPQFSNSGCIYGWSMAIISASITATTMSFTKANSETRIVATILVTITTFEFHQAIDACVENRLWKALITTAMWIQCLQSLDNLCLTRISYTGGSNLPPKTHLHNDNGSRSEMTSSLKETTRPKPPKLSRAQISWGWSMLWNMRAVLTPWSIKNIPPFSYTRKKFLPTRGRFLLMHMRTIMLASFILDIFNQLPPPNIEDTMSQKHQYLFSRLSEVTVEELVVRIFAVLGFWINTACTVSLINSAFAVIHVGLRLQDPVSWPPIFGKLSESYSVRHFWGVTWHQTLRRSLTSMSDFISRTVVRVPRGTLLARYMKLFLSFFISGCLHVVADLVLGVPPGESGALHFFVFTALAILIEDGVQELWQRVFGTASSGWRIYFGYVWVMSFMIWTVPTWAYAAARWVRPQEDVLLPFSITKIGKSVLNECNYKGDLFVE